MILSAHECRARASEARELAQQAKRTSTKTALEQVAEYWFALAERVEQRDEEQPGTMGLHLPVTVEAHTDSMPVFTYLVSVGAALILGLLAVSAQFDSQVPDASAGSAQTNAALLSAKPY
jgi:hypothetical protein